MASPSYLSIPHLVRLRDPVPVRSSLDAFLARCPQAAQDLDEHKRSEWATVLISDLDAASVPRTERSTGWDDGVRLLALQVLKELGRLPGGSHALAEPKSLRVLVSQIEVRPLPSTPPDQSPSLPSSSVPQRVRPASPSPRRSSPIASPTVGSPSTADTAGKNKKDPYAITDVALRCLNNALYLHERARKTFVEIDVDDALDLVSVADHEQRNGKSAPGGGGAVVVKLLEHPSRTPAEIQFLAARILFFITLFEASFNKVAVDELGIVDTLTGSLASLLATVVPPTQTPAPVPPRSKSPFAFASSSSSTPSSPSSSAISASIAGFSPAPGTPQQALTAITDILKLVFNLGLYYPRLRDRERREKGKAEENGEDGDSDEAAVATGAWDPKLEKLLPVLTHIVTDLPPSQPVPLVPPVTNAIGVLLNYPVAPSRSVWFRPADPQPAAASSSSPGGISIRRFSGAISSLVSSSSSSHFRSSSPSPAGAQASSSANQSPGGGGGSAQGASGTPPSGSGTSSPVLSTASLLQPAFDDLPALPARLILYLSTMTSTYIPQDPDSKFARQLATKHGFDIEDTLQPLVLVVRKMVEEDLEMSRAIKRVVLPDDIDRAVSLDKREDLTGRLVRIMGSVLLPRLARAAGELLLSLCDGDPQTMTNQIGYGPCAGFLMQKNMLSAIPGGPHPAAPGKSDAEAGRTINPITGMYDPLPEEGGAGAGAEMTMEEKELEAERLFTLFDRLDRTGVVKVKNPMKEAEESGRFEEIEERAEEEERRRREVEEVEDERVVEKEMRERKERQEKARQKARAMMEKSMAAQAQKTKTTAAAAAATAATAAASANDRSGGSKTEEEAR